MNNKLCPRLDQAARVLQCTHKEKTLQEHMNLTSTTELIIVIVALFISVISFVVYSCTCDSIAHINNIFFLWIELRKINNIKKLYYPYPNIHASLIYVVMLPNC